MVVIGAGPSGSTAAKIIAEQGIHVLLVEKESFPRTKSCGGGLPIRTFERFPYLKNKEIINSYSFGGYVYSSSYNSVKIKKEEPVLAMIQRSIFDKSLVDIAINKGAIFEDNKKAIHIDIQSTTPSITFKDGTNITADLIIGADGFHSTVAKKTELLTNHQQFGICLFEEVPMDPETINTYFTKNHVCHIFSKFHGLTGYGWVFPKKDTVNVGLVSYKLKKTEQTSTIHMKNIYNRFFSHLQQRNILPATLTSKNAKGGFLPVKPLDKTYTDHVILCGDAAGLINPISGEGIYYALTSGEIAGTIAAKAIKKQDTTENYLSLYQRQWQNEFGKEINLLLKSRKQWGKNGERMIQLMKKDDQFADLVFTVIIGKQSFYDLRWKLIKEYAKARLNIFKH